MEAEDSNTLSSTNIFIVLKWCSEMIGLLMNILTRTGEYIIRTKHTQYA